MTLREQIIRYVFAAVKAANIGAITYTRSRVSPFAREECPAVNLEPTDETANQVTVPKTDWMLTLVFTVVIRGGNLDSDADSIIQQLHAAVMADLSQGGLAMDTQPSSVRWKFADADAGACDVECEYRIQYRTSQNDLTIH